MRALFLLVVLTLAAVTGPAAQPPGPVKEKAERHRSPIDLAVLPGGSLVLTANHTADSVSLVDVERGRVLAELPCGPRPAAVACSRDGRKVAVSHLWSDSLSLFEVRDRTLSSVGPVVVGAQPRGLVFAPDGNSLYVALAGADEVVQADWTRRRVVHRWPAPREPRQLALSNDGRRLVAASSRSGHVRLWDTASRQLVWEKRIEDGFNLRGLTFTSDEQFVICAHVIRREFPVAPQNIDAGWVMDNRLTRLAVDAQARPGLWQIALDPRGKAVGDPHGLLFGGEARWLALTAAGTHELLILDTKQIFWNAGEPGDFIDSSLQVVPDAFRRVALEGRPLSVAALDQQRAIVVNQLRDALQVVDLAQAKLTQTIHLGGPAKASLARQGEAIFYDAKRSHHQWFSCHTCHVDGHTCGLNFDTLNDDSYGNPKLTPTLRNVARTGPWTWHGWQKDLGQAVSKSLTESMFGPDPSADDVRAVVAFLETLEHPPNPHARPSDAVARGKDLFHNQARCARCHSGDLYVSEGTFDVKLEADGSPFPRWNPPSLIGVWDRGPYLHDGRAKTLGELLERHHASEKLGGQPLNPAERQDLIEFLKSL